MEGGGAVAKKKKKNTKIAAKDAIMFGKEGPKNKKMLIKKKISAKHQISSGTYITNASIMYSL